MLKPDRLELLYRTSDMLDSIASEEHSLLYPHALHLKGFDDALSRLSNAGLDVSNFRLPPSNTGAVNITDFRARLNAARGFVARQIQRHEQAGRAVAEQSAPPPNNNTVFVVQGQDSDAVDTVHALLREVQLVPRDFSDARRLTSRPMPYIGEVLNAAFKHAQAVLVLFSPDERVELKERLRSTSQPIQVEFQPRPNVLIEAGIALATHSNRTVILEMGNVRSPSDLAGRHVVRWADDTPMGRSDLLDRLREAGCQPNRENPRWMTVGKKDRPTWA